MSYILDALKKSEQQRGDNTIPAAVATTITQPAPAKRWFVLPLILLASALAAGWFIVQLNRPDQHQPPTPASRSVISPPVLSSQTVSSQTIPPQTASPQTVSSQTATSLASPPSRLQMPPPSNHGQQPASATTTTPTKLTEHHASPPGGQSDPIPVFTPITPTSSVSRIAGPLPDVPGQAQPAPAETNILAISELPLSVQQALPALHIEGHIYDDNPSARMVIINGAAYRQKQHITGGLILEEITPKGVILNYQGHVFHMGVFE